MFGHSPRPNLVFKNIRSNSFVSSQVMPRSPQALGFRNARFGRESALDEDAESPMQYVAFMGGKECVNELLKWGHVNVKSSLDTPPLHKTLAGWQQEVVEMLIEARADVNVPLLYGRTPLHFTAAMGQEHAALYFGAALILALRTYLGVLPTILLCGTITIHH